jgi:hypothetical protein
VRALVGALHEPSLSHHAERDQGRLRQRTGTSCSPTTTLQPSRAVGRRARRCRRRRCGWHREGVCDQLPVEAG